MLPDDLLGHIVNQWSAVNKGVVSKMPSSKQFLITFLTVVCGRDLWSNSSASYVGSCYLTVITASILT